MLKVLFLTNNLGGGGAERVLVNLVNRMSEDGYDITLRLLTNQGSNREKLSNKVHLEYLFRRYYRGLSYLYLLPHKWIYEKVAHGEYDVIVVYLHGVLTRIVSYAPKAQKTIAYLHANMEVSPFIMSFRNQAAIQKCFNEYNRIVSVSKDVKESFVRVSGINDDRLVVKYNTFNTEAIKRSSSDIIPQNIEHDRIVLCSVGKLEEVKGYLRLLKIVFRLIQEGYKIRLMIVGEGPERDTLESYIQETGLEKYITLVGFDVNPYKYIAKSDLFVGSSYTEGFSSVVAESLILGVPVITTDCAGMREMLGNQNEYGVITENNDEALYLGIKQMITDKEKLKYYTNQARKRGSFFSEDSTVHAVENMIEEVVNEQ